jgi:hypothetical protein
MKANTEKKKVFRADNNQTELLIKAGRKGAMEAVRASKALGLNITYMEKGVVYREKPDGTKEVLKKIDLKNKSLSDLGLRKGMILHAKS